MEWNLLEKTTFWVEGVDLVTANLGAVSAAAAAALGLEPAEIMVVDVRPGMVAFDILSRRVRAEAIAGKEKTLLDWLASVPGIKLSPGALIHSEGILGLIALDEKEAGTVLERAGEMADEIRTAVGRRALVFASGIEVKEGKIVDTNSPYIISALRRAGFTARFGGVLEDNAAMAARSLVEALERGYGLIVTTGGVGAEDKDFCVEAVCRIDPLAHTPWILKFTPDGRRHHKEGVRIALGHSRVAKLVALPGPHEEARLGCERLIAGLESGLDGAALAEFIAHALRERWRHMASEGRK